MKTTLFFFAVLFNAATYAQSWAPAGAKWHYSYIGFASGYVEIANVGDTVIAGQTCQKLQKTFNGLQFGVTPMNYVFDTTYTYENNGVVYVLEQNQWKTLYDFNAVVGAHWPMAPYPEFGGCTANSQLKVTATGTKVINAETLKYMVVDFCNPDLTSQGFQDTILEKIGFTGSYMFPFDVCTMAFDGNEGGPFRCYSDNNFSTYKPFYDEACDFIVGMEELADALQIELAPNPSNGVFEIKTENQEPLDILVYNQAGELVSKHHFENPSNNASLNLTTQAKGIYFAYLSQDGQKGVSSLVVE
jgi:hypothetical protein